jgi:hypothetical protein
VTVRLCWTGVQEVLPYWRVLDLHRCRCVACLVNKVLLFSTTLSGLGLCGVRQVGVAVRTLAQAPSPGLPPYSRCTPTLTSRHWCVCHAAEVGDACGKHGLASLIGSCVRIPIPPFLHSSIPPFLHSSIHPFHHASMPPFLHSSIPLTHTWQERFLGTKVLVQVEIAHSKTFLDAVLLLQAPMPAGGACGSADVCVGACVYGCVCGYSCLCYLESV